MRRIAALSLLLATVTALAVIGFRQWWKAGLDEPLPVAARDTSAAEVEKFCSTCHVLPPPDCEPQFLWPEKIKEMYGYATSSRAWPETQMPPIQDPIEYFLARAPAGFELPADANGSPPSPLAFQSRPIVLEGIPGPPAISNVKFVRLSDDAPVQLLISEMRHGLVFLWTPSRPAEPARIISRVPHPCRTHVVDLDGDGVQDILVANLGVFWNVDTDQGSVVWLRGRGDGQFETIVLFDRLSRVNDMLPADFDGDGDLDLVVAVFGNFTTGMIVYLENFTEDYAEPDFEAISLDGHTGTSDVPGVDLNGDGRLDFLALQSQQHEQIVAFLNAKKGRFRSEVVYAAPHPRWGSTGIKLVDLDEDGDVDILFNHGDSVQVPPVLRPYHGFGWLENHGELSFTYHRLTHLPGAHTSQAADLDNDGDLDIVSSVFIPAFDPTRPDASQLETVIWLSQTQRGQFQRYALETGTAVHPCLDLGDYDQDGDIDIVLGNFILFPKDGQPWTANLTVLENQLIENHADPARGRGG